MQEYEEDGEYGASNTALKKDKDVNEPEGTAAASVADGAYLHFTPVPSLNLNYTSR
jgi:hypothetical protein